MLGWALVFFVLALAAAALGFGGLAGVSASIAQILFVVFLALTVLAFVVRRFRKIGHFSGRGSTSRVCCAEPGHQAGLCAFGGVISAPPSR